MDKVVFWMKILYIEIMVYIMRIVDFENVYWDIINVSFLSEILLVLFGN